MHPLFERLGVVCRRHIPDLVTFIILSVVLALAGVKKTEAGNSHFLKSLLTHVTLF